MITLYRRGMRRLLLVSMVGMMACGGTPQRAPQPVPVSGSGGETPGPGCECSRLAVGQHWPQVNGHTAPLSEEETSEIVSIDPKSCMVTTRAVKSQAAETPRPCDSQFFAEPRVNPAG
jgi:hypothetical protein